MNTPLRQMLLEQSLGMIGRARPLVADIAQLDRNLASQLRRALTSVALNVAEGFGNQGGNARLRFRTALGSLHEAQAALRVAATWGYISDERAQLLVDELQHFGGRVYGLSKR